MRLLQQAVSFLVNKCLLQQALLSLSLVLPVAAQLPKASFTYGGTGCGWFAQRPENQIAVTYPPVIGQHVEFRTPIPPFGIDVMYIGHFDPNWRINATCRLHAYSLPSPYMVPIRNPFTRFTIPNHPSLVGKRFYIQQMNWAIPGGWNAGKVWEASRVVIIRPGY